MKKIVNKIVLFYVFSIILVLTTVITGVFVGTVSLTVTDVIKIIVQNMSGLSLYHTSVTWSSLFGKFDFHA
ncbi:hypothetical protein OC195_13005 [Priestia flexa]|nr:hypothetical protein OC195_13005 [Priestia flexa]